MRTIQISIQKSKVARTGEEAKLIAVGSDGKTIGIVRGLSGGRIHQLLNSEGITVDSSRNGRLIDLFALKNITLVGEIEVVKKGQPFTYSKEQLESIGEITGRRTLESTPEPVVAGVEYVSGSDGFRVTNFDTLQINFSMEQMKFFQSFKYNTVKTVGLAETLAEDLVED